MENMVKLEAVRERNSEDKIFGLNVYRVANSRTAYVKVSELQELGMNVPDESEQLTVNPSHLSSYVRLRSRVTSRRYRHVGVVCEINHSFKSSNEDDEWFDGQRPKLPEEAKKERWISILNDGGGLTMMPESDLTVHEDNARYNENPWFHYYFSQLADYQA